MPDWEIQAHIEKRMASHSQLSDVKVEVVGGVVTLTGTVPDEEWWKTAQIIGKMTGVKEVRNKLKRSN